MKSFSNYSTTIYYIVNIYNATQFYNHAYGHVHNNIKPIAKLTIVLNNNQKIKKILIRAKANVCMCVYILFTYIYIHIYAYYNNI